MKKLTALLLVMILIFSMIGCNNPSSNDRNGDVIEVSCYVTCVKFNGFVAHIYDVGYVFVKYANAKKQIDVFDTVIVEYYENELIEKNGTYVDVSGERMNYSYMIKSPVSARIADPSKGEPVFG